MNSITTICLPTLCAFSQAPMPCPLDGAQRVLFEETQKDFHELFEKLVLFKRQHSFVQGTYIIGSRASRIILGDPSFPTNDLDIRIFISIDNPEGFFAKELPDAVSRAFNCPKSWHSNSSWGTADYGDIQITFIWYNLRPAWPEISFHVDIESGASFCLNREGKPASAQEYDRAQNNLCLRQLSHIPHLELLHDPVFLFFQAKATGFTYPSEQEKIACQHLGALDRFRERFASKLEQHGPTLVKRRAYLSAAFTILYRNRVHQDYLNCILDEMRKDPSPTVALLFADATSLPCDLPSNLNELERTLLAYLTLSRQTLVEAYSGDVTALDEEPIYFASLDVEQRSLFEQTRTTFAESLTALANFQQSNPFARHAFIIGSHALRILSKDSSFPTGPLEICIFGASDDFKESADFANTRVTFARNDLVMTWPELSFHIDIKTGNSFCLNGSIEPASKVQHAITRENLRTKKLTAAPPLPSIFSFFLAKTNSFSYNAQQEQRACKYIVPLDHFCQQLHEELATHCPSAEKRLAYLATAFDILSRNGVASTYLDAVLKTMEENCDARFSLDLSILEKVFILSSSSIPFDLIASYMSIDRIRSLSSSSDSRVRSFVKKIDSWLKYRIDSAATLTHEQREVLWKVCANNKVEMERFFATLKSASLLPWLRRCSYQDWTRQYPYPDTKMRVDLENITATVSAVQDAFSSGNEALMDAAAFTVQEKMLAPTFLKKEDLDRFGRLLETYIVYGKHIDDKKLIFALVFMQERRFDEKKLPSTFTYIKEKLTSNTLAPELYSIIIPKLPRWLYFYAEGTVVLPPCAFETLLEHFADCDHIEEYPFTVVRATLAYACDHPHASSAAPCIQKILSSRTVCDKKDLQKVAAYLKQAEQKYCYPVFILLMRRLNTLEDGGDFNSFIMEFSYDGPFDELTECLFLVFEWFLIFGTIEECLNQVDISRRIPFPQEHKGRYRSLLCRFHTRCEAEWASLPVHHKDRISCAFFDLANVFPLFAEQTIYFSQLVSQLHRAPFDPALRILLAYFFQSSARRCQSLVELCAFIDRFWPLTFSMQTTHSDLLFYKFTLIGYCTDPQLRAFEDITSQKDLYLLNKTIAYITTTLCFYGSPALREEQFPAELFRHIAALAQRIPQDNEKFLFASWPIIITKTIENIRLVLSTLERGSQSTIVDGLYIQKITTLTDMLKDASPSTIDLVNKTQMHIFLSMKVLLCLVDSLRFSPHATPHTWQTLFVQLYHSPLGLFTAPHMLFGSQTPCNTELFDIIDRILAAFPQEEPETLSIKSTQARRRTFCCEAT